MEIKNFYKINGIVLALIFLASVTVITACASHKTNCHTSKSKKANMKKNTTFMVR